MVFPSSAMADEPVLNLQLQARLEEAAARLSGERATVLSITGLCVKRPMQELKTTYVYS
jgi:hypothetical protein